MTLLPVSIQENEVVAREAAKLAASRRGWNRIELPGQVWISVERQADPTAIRAVLARAL